MDRHSVERFGRHRNGFVRLLGGEFFVVVFERDAGEQFLRFHQLRIGLQRGLREFGGLMVPRVGRKDREP